MQRLESAAHLAHMKRGHEILLKLSLAPSGCVSCIRKRILALLFT